MEPFEPLEWQQSTSDLILGSRGRKSYIFAKSRQAGATTEVLSLVDYIALSKPHLTALFLHKTYLDAHYLGRRNRKFLSSANVPLEGDSVARQEFENGSTLYFRSSDPESCGRGLDSVDIVVYEECGFYIDLRSTVEAIAPAQRWCEDAISIFVTTPNGKVGSGEYYWSLLASGCGPNEVEGRFKAIREGLEEPFQIWDANGAMSKIIVHWRAIPINTAEPDFKARVMAESGMSEESFAQEFDLDFSVGDSENVFDFELLRGCQVDSIDEWEPGGIFYTGIDPAGVGKDYSVCLTLERIIEGDRILYQVVDLYRKRTGTTQQHLLAIADLLEEFEPITALVERNGLGQIWEESLPAVEGHTTTQSSKEALIARLKLAIERGDLRIPKGPIMDELAAFRRSANGKLEAPQGLHDDCVIALALALKAADYAQAEMAGFYFHAA